MIEFKKTGGSGPASFLHKKIYFDPCEIFHEVRCAVVGQFTLCWMPVPVGVPHHHNFFSSSLISTGFSTSLVHHWHLASTFG